MFNSSNTFFKNSFFIKLLSFTALMTVMYAPTAFACLSCGCGTSGSSSDLSSIGGAASIFAKDKRFLIQVGSSYKDVNGSFNESGTWNPKPYSSNLSALQNTISLMYFPVKNLSIGFQVPHLINFFSDASYGSFGSIAPTDSGFKSGMNIGDIGTQLSYKLYEENNFALIPWLKADFPTGQSEGIAENISGGGVLKLTGGMLAIKTIEKFELIFNLGYQQPFGSSLNASNTFNSGNALLGQFNTNYQFTNEIKAGIGLSGFIGKWLYGNNNMAATKIKLTASGQYDFSMYNGVGISTGYDPQFLGKNTTTDINFNLVFYQFL